jgi:hypothetical protein
MKLTLTATAAILVFVGSSAANATPLTLDINPSNTYQQQQNSPCVIGDPSCQNPSGFGSTTLSPSTSTYTDVNSPSYTVQQIRDLVGDNFLVGIDVNTTTHPQATEILDSFSLAIAGTTQFTYTGPQQLNTNNNGNGYSDALLSGFDLSSFNGSSSAVFTVSYHDATDGREQFFLISGQASPVPEPATLGLIGLGLAALALRRKTI